jgi:hypothetical protein
LQSFWKVKGLTKGDQRNRVKDERSIAMICQTVKVGTECIFMKKNGCSYNGGRCYPIVVACKGCDRVVPYEVGSYCKTCCEPSVKWVKAPCNFATHVKKEVKEDTFKLNPLKASKRNVAQKI